MNSRERLLAALECEVPDRVPISTYELVGYNTLAWENNDPSYARLMAVIREKTDCICMWNPDCNWTFLASSFPVDREVREWSEGNATVTRQTVHTPKGVLTETRRAIDGLHTSWRTEPLCKSIEDVEKALSIPYQPVEFDASDYGRIRSEVGDNGIIMSSWGDALPATGGLMGFGEYLIWARYEPEHFAKTLATIHTRIMDSLSNMLKTAPVDLYRIPGPELATPPYLPPEFFKRFVVPYVSEMVALIHNKGAKARLHCHGRIGQVLDMMLATGADGIDPCEGPPDGDIRLADVKRRIGAKMSIFGNIQPKVLEHGSETDVTEAVKQCMAASKTGGGFVVMPTSAPIETPLSPTAEANYVRYIDAALEYGGY